MKMIGFDFYDKARAAFLAGFGEGVAALYRDLHRRLRPAAFDVRKQFPGRQGHLQLSGDLEHLQAHRRRAFRRREGRPVQRRSPKRPIDLTV